MVQDGLDDLLILDEADDTHGPPRRIMKSLQVLGKNVTVEVTHISKAKVWLLAGDRELFMSYEDFPWFQEAPVRKIMNVEEPYPGHFYWPELDRERIPQAPPCRRGEGAQ